MAVISAHSRPVEYVDKIAIRLYPYLHPYIDQCRFVWYLIVGVYFFAWSTSGYLTFILITPTFQSHVKWLGFHGANYFSGFLILGYYAILVQLVRMGKFPVFKWSLNELACFGLPIAVVYFTKYCEENSVTLYEPMMLFMWGWVFLLSLLAISEDYSFLDNFVALTLVITFKRYPSKFGWLCWTVLPGLCRRVFPNVTKVFIKINERKISEEAERRQENVVTLLASGVRY
ncbi:hypothetical protein ACH5RR_035342 [Cinchona calisaya]|uniref:Uncharacterized protein n=1 Tax=Cinchona calisaya TaxID=153742 RepID=A0ABD2YEV7_9GENT